MLRYYEQNGLIESLRKEDYSYRVYDETALVRLKQIILLRKLRIPVKQICSILNNDDASIMIEIFKENVKEINKEINALSTIKSILNQFVEKLNAITNVNIKVDLLTDSSLALIIEALSLTNNHIKEEKSLEKLNNASKSLSKLKDVRVVFLPPMTVAASYYTGENSEMHSSRALENFVKESGLLKMKPDTRHFGFNNSIKRTGIGEPSPGYEMWVSIPNDMEVPQPLIKRRFFGGLYAAHVINMGEFDYWLALQEWVSESDKYQNDANSIRCEPYMEGMDSQLEEQLNYYNNIQDKEFDNNTMQLDLLFPIKLASVTKEEVFEIPHSEDICGFKAKLMVKNKFKIMGFTRIITPAMGEMEEAVQAFWKDKRTDGGLECILKHKKPGARIFGFGSFDSECRKAGGWRYTICIQDSDIIDLKSFKSVCSFNKSIDASKWICFEMTKEKFINSFWKENPHAIIKKLGYNFNGPISGHFDVFNEDNTRIYDQNNQEDKNSIVHFWMPIK
jgi:DNA-binding transcriptional MerR regulator/predicted transcriptional regulator YdeE